MISKRIILFVIVIASLTQFSLAQTKEVEYVSNIISSLDKEDSTDWLTIQYVNKDSSELHSFFIVDRNDFYLKFKTSTNLDSVQVYKAFRDDDYFSELIQNINSTSSINHLQKLTEKAPNNHFINITFSKNGVKKSFKMSDDILKNTADDKNLKNLFLNIVQAERLFLRKNTFDKIQFLNQIIISKYYNELFPWNIY